MPQDRRGAQPGIRGSINDMLVEKALAGKVVAASNGATRSSSAGGGEECEVLAAAGIPFEVVPGVTAGSGATAYAGIPLTHRDITTSVTFVTGHESRPGRSRALTGHVSAGQRHPCLLLGNEKPGRDNGDRWPTADRARYPRGMIRWGPARSRVLAARWRHRRHRARKAGFQGAAITVVGDVVRPAGQAPLV